MLANLEAQSIVDAIPLPTKPEGPCFVEAILARPNPMVDENANQAYKWGKWSGEYWLVGFEAALEPSIRTHSKEEQGNRYCCLGFRFGSQHRSKLMERGQALAEKGDLLPLDQEHYPLTVSAHHAGMQRLATAHHAQIPRYSNPRLYATNQGYEDAWSAAANRKNIGNGGPRNASFQPGSLRSG